MHASPTSAPAPWAICGREVDYDAGIFKVLRRVAVPPDSEKQHDFRVIESADWVNVVPLTTADDLILVRQFRAGIERHTLEIPGGAVEPGESPLDAARRELREETGYAALHWTELGVVHPNPALQTNRCWSFLALDVTLAGPPSPDEGEEITVVTHELARVGDLIADGSISHALVVGALHQCFARAGGWCRPQ